jgi:hypothetical protein
MNGMTSAQEGFFFVWRLILHAGEYMRACPDLSMQYYEPFGIMRKILHSPLANPF